MRKRQPSTHALPPSGKVWAAAGLCLGLVVSLGMWAPAQWLAAGLNRLTQGHLQIVGARGTLWSGQGQLLLTGGRDSQDSVLLPGPVQWNIGHSGTKLQVDLKADCCTPQALRVSIQPGWGQSVVTLQSPGSHWPASLLSGLGTPWNTLQAQGDITLASDSLSMHWAAGRWRLEGSVQMEARHISSRLSTLRPMGSYRLSLQGGDAPQLQLSTLEGALRLNGNGQWVGSRWRFEGTAEALPDREDALSNFLNIIGRRQGARSIITLG